MFMNISNLNYVLNIKKYNLDNLLIIYLDDPTEDLKVILI